MRRIEKLSVVAVILALLAGEVSLAETWSERLGFPPDKKVVILHAHQMGLCRATNSAAEKLTETELTFSSSALAPSPWFANYARSKPGDVGLALTINSEWPEFRWHPVAPDHLVPSLVDSEGYFWQSSIQTMVNSSAAEVEEELRHQIVKARMAGLQPSHFTTHLGTLYTRLDLTEVYFKLAREYWIPAVVVELTPSHIERFEEQGFPLPPELRQLVADYPLPKLDDLQFVDTANSYEQKKRDFIALIGNLEPGLTQVALSPAVESEELKHIVDDWKQRVWEFELLQDPDVRSVLTSGDVVLTTWQDLLHRFAGKGSIVENAKSEHQNGSREP